MNESHKAIFLSYASQDAAAASELAKALRAAGLEVWFDQSELRGGDAWDASIRRQIKACTLFIPVISRNTHEREEGYFRLEWKLAVDRSHLMATSKAFLLPVVIDDTRDNDERVPDRFREVQWTRLLGGKATPAFVERVVNLLASTRGIDSSPAAASANPGASAPRPRNSRAALWLALAAIVIIGAAEAYRLAATRNAKVAQTTAVPEMPAAPAANAIPEKSIAVLPFVDMSEKKDQEYFSDGLAEELLDLLAQIRELHVAARTSSFSFKGKSDDVAVIAQKLRVSHVLEGSVRRSGDVIRVSAQLIRADNGYDLWSKTYDRQVKDIFKVQDEIAAAVVDALKLQLMPTEQIESKHWTSNTEAYSQFLLGNQYRVLDTYESNPKALAAYQKAVALDPGYAAAWAGLSDTEWRIADQNTNDPADYARALASANKAIELAPASAAGYWARGNLKQYYEWDWNAATADYEKAVSLDANFSRAYMDYGRLLASLCKMQESQAMMQRALNIDPLSIDILRNLGRIQYDMGQVADALGTAKRVQEINTGAEERLVGFTKLRGGQFKEAQAAFIASPTALKLMGISMSEYSLGDRDASDRDLQQFIKEHGQPLSYQIASAYAWQGDKDKAFQWLETAFQIHDGGLTYLTHDFTLDKIRDDPRFAALLRKMNLPLTCAKPGATRT